MRAWVWEGKNQIRRETKSLSSFSLALDGLGDLAPLGSGVLMTLIGGGALVYSLFGQRKSALPDKGYCR